jgi:hypothetical protein
MTDQKKDKLATEVQLCWKTMTCRGMRCTYGTSDHPCRFFNDHYGPYPAFDWIDRESEVSSQDEPRTIEANCVGTRYNVPEMMSGCRKAPVMTIGINPNLTAFYPGPNGSRWAYPYFDNIAQYAEYFRYRSIHQEAFSLDFIKKHLEPGSEIKATESGILSNASIDNQTSEVTLKLTYDGGQGLTTIPLSRDYEVLWPNAKRERQKLARLKDDPIAVKRESEKLARFKKGDTIAAKLALPDGAKTHLIQESVEYYKRFEGILDRFKDRADLGDSLLAMGEDVCQGDMVACASPGWGGYLNATQRKEIAEECVHKRRLLPVQLMQTRPACVVFSGRAALGMFIDSFPGAITPSLDTNKDPFTLLRQCSEEEIWLTVDTPSGAFRSRVILSGHFSYRDNFIEGSRFTSDQWDRFSGDFPADVKKLAKAGIVKKVYGKARVVEIRSDKAPPMSEISEPARSELEERYMNPPDIIASILQQEYDAGRISYDQTTKHLARSPSACQFCDNSLFALPGGCAYGKVEDPKLSTPSTDELNPFIEKMLGGS